MLISLFDGIGGAHCALAKLGWPIHEGFSSEIDPVALKVLKSRRPAVTELGDTREMDVGRIKEIATEAPLTALFLLIAGPPCQDNSSLRGERREGLAQQPFLGLRQSAPGF